MALDHALTPEGALPLDGTAGTLIARIWLPGKGPAVVRVDADGVYDLTRRFPTIADILTEADPAVAVNAATPSGRIGALADILAASAPNRRNEDEAHFLAPQDIQPGQSRWRYLCRIYAGARD